MASILEYALSLKTSAFDNPLRASQGNLEKFEAKAGATSGRLAGLSAGFSGAATAVGLFAAVTAGAKATLESYAEFDGLVRGLKTLEGTAPATAKRLAELRETAKAPGLGFEEAVRGDIRLRAVGISADLSTRSMKAFGNALATVGGGASDLDGVLLALTQIQSKGSVSAEEINQIAERVPQMRAAMKAAFGTAASEDIQKLGITTTQFINGVVAELEKLPAVTGGARNTLDNYTDSWKALKTEATEFGVGIAGSWIDMVSGAFQQARRDLISLQSLFGIATPGLGGKDGQTDAQREAAKAAEEAAAKAKAAAADQRRLDLENFANRAKLAQEWADAQEAEAKAKAERDKQREQSILAAQEKVFAARLTQEQNLQRQIAALQNSGPSGAAAINAARDLGVKEQIAQRTAELLTLQRELKDLQERDAEAARTKAEAAEREAKAKEEQRTAQQQAADFFRLENEILRAKAAGNTKLEESLQKQAKTEQLKLELMREQGLSEKDAAAAAAQRIALEERAAKGGSRRGIRSAADTAAAASERLQGRMEGIERSGGRAGNSDRLALADLERRKSRAYSPSAAAEELARGRAAADPGKVRREERAEAKKPADQQLLKTVKDIADKFDNLATE